MADLEKLAYQEGADERLFMENAGKGIALAVHRFIEEHKLPPKVWLLCGKGNNGGDAFVAGRYLLEKNYSVTAVQTEELQNCSPLCKENGLLFISRGGERIQQIFQFNENGLILDGIFGTGFKGQITGLYASLINTANKSKLPILSIDIASGLNGSNGETSSEVIHATQTIFLGLPKIGFFLENGWNITGKLSYVDFGLSKSIIERAESSFELITETIASELLPAIKRNRYKYETGSVAVLAGSPGMPGAALLASLAAFRGGCGIVRLLHPTKMLNELSNSPYELIKIPYEHEELDEAIEIIGKAKASLIGPGLGRDEKTRSLLRTLVPRLNHPCIIDADALLCIAEGVFKIPKNAILTPHTGEMQALLKSENPIHRSLKDLRDCQNYAEENKVTLILKGAPSFIFHPNKPIFVNSTGDPGMATAGSGDVLAGLLSALLSQGLTCHHAAILGVYLHGRAGELAAKAHQTSYGVMAEDLIDQFGPVYHHLEKTKNKFVTDPFIDFLK